MPIFNIYIVSLFFLLMFTIYGDMTLEIFIIIWMIETLIFIPIAIHVDEKEKEAKEKQQAENLRHFNEEKYEREKKYAIEQECQREIEEHEIRKEPTCPSYTPSYSFANDSSYSSVASGFDYSTVRPNDDFLNKMGNPYLSNYEKHLLVKEDIQRMVDSHLPMNSIYRNSDGSVKQHDYSAFGIAANTPDIDLAEAQMFDDFI